ncbi:hypothetical protein ELUMI_v1c04780 [Williamsoniiplasma luminosum]|uniref:Uncharacterized protein n=1 Tax=Williamsoniiplasma luminosum TaxID=214888 RepID=A0A2K8NTN4_9MOLU|nr:hypothetical protein [Williamsoniiplasma luminosum]ATZ17202.1 hypothetical protein ELUMI_v1c04780 [Williamsoniiplasma luminosum]
MIINKINKSDFIYKPVNSFSFEMEYRNCNYCSSSKSFDIFNYVNKNCGTPICDQCYAKLEIESGIE